MALIGSALPSYHEFMCMGRRHTAERATQRRRESPVLVEICTEELGGSLHHFLAAKNSEPSCENSDLTVSPGAFAVSSIPKREKSNKEIRTMC